MDHIFQSQIATIKSSKVENNKLYLSITITKKLVLFYFDLLKHVQIKIKTEEYLIDQPGKYHIFFSVNRKETTINLEIVRVNNFTLTPEILQDVIRSIKVYEYGNPIVVSDKKYQIMYSFDKNYYSGASAF